MGFSGNGMQWPHCVEIGQNLLGWKFSRSMVADELHFLHTDTALQDATGP